MLTRNDAVETSREATTFKPNEPRFRGSKPTSEVEFPKVRVEIDMQPFHAAFAGIAFRMSDEISADAATAPIRMNGCVQEEGMDTTVPSNVHESDEVARVVSTNISKTPLQDWTEVATRMLRPSGTKKLVERLVRHRPIDVVFDAGIFTKNSWHAGALLGTDKIVRQAVFQRIMAPTARLTPTTPTSEA